MIVIYNGFGAQKLQNPLLGRLDPHCQELFILTPVDRENPVPRHFAEGFLILVIHLINALRLFIPGCGYKLSFLHRDIADIDAVIRLVIDALGDNIFRSLQSLLR